MENLALEIEKIFNINGKKFIEIDRIYNYVDELITMDFWDGEEEYSKICFRYELSYKNFYNKIFVFHRTNDFVLYPKNEEIEFKIIGDSEKILSQLSNLNIWKIKF